MASTVPKVGPSLRGGGEGTADALAGGLVVEAKRQKKLVTADAIKVSNNFGATLQRRYPSRKGSGPSAPDSSPAASRVDGSPTGSKADVIPSDEEVSDAETSLTVLGVRLGGRFARAPDEERDFAVEAARQARGDSEVEDTDNDEDVAAFDGAGGRAQVRPTNRAGQPPQKKSTRGNVDTPSIDPLRFGMDVLRDSMKVPGTAAHRFAATMGSFDDNDEWADEFGAFVTAIREEDTALEQALSPDHESQPYLAIDKNSSCFVVLHGLRRWTPNRSRNSGRLIAWEGETTQQGDPPDLWRFDDDEAKLFQLIPFSEVDLRKVLEFYSDEGNDEKFIGVDDHSHEEGHWVSRLIPIPTGWAAMFLDYPPLGVGIRRITDLINSVAVDKADNFRVLAWQMACACHRTSGTQPTSSMSLNWSRLPRSKSNLTLSARAWRLERDPASPGRRKDPPEQMDDFQSLFGGGKRPKLNLGHWAPTGRANTRGGENIHRSARSPVRASAQQPTSAHTADLASMLAAMVQAQTDGQIAVAAANTANLVAFTTATAQALATSSGGEKGSKLTQARKSVLQACTGEGDSATFVLPPVFLAMTTDGGTTDALSLTLRRLLQPDGLNARHRTQLYVTPQLVQTVKTFNFSASGDKSFAGSSRGITVFAVPWRTHESMTEEAAEEECYQQSTHKTVADVRKHTAGTKVDIPSDLLGLSRLCNNYCKLLEVLFGPRCPHLTHVTAIRDGLELHEHDLEMKITKTLCLHLLWRIHFDARQFFTACERWAPGAPVPQSSLGGTVLRLVEDCSITECLTCPVGAFMGSTGTSRSGGTTPSTRTAQATKPTTNPSIPAICRPTVDLFNSQYPTMSFMSLIKKGGLKYSDLQVGGKGDCSSFGLLGRCGGGCTYNHVVCTVSAERQAAINVALKAAMVALKKPRPAAPSAPRSGAA